MKKVYLGMFALAIVGGVNAQSFLKNERKAPLAKRAQLEMETSNKKETSLDNSRGALIWDDDFSSASTWVFTNSSSPSADWEYTTDPLEVPVISGGTDPIQTSTASNGYVYIDSDSYGGGATQNCTIETATSFSCSGVDYVKLQWEQDYMHFYETLTVSVSGDNGVSWDDYVVDNGAVQSPQVREYTTKSLDISATAGNATDVLIRFTYEGAWDWYWTIDDVAVYEIDADDVSADETFRANLDEDVPYTQLPLIQTRPLGLGLAISNVGINSQDAYFDYDVAFGGTSVETGSSATSTIPNNAGDTVYHTTSITPNAVGVYTIDMIDADIAPAVDANVNDNVGETMDLVEITDDVWAIDDGTPTRVLSAANFIAPYPGNAFEVGMTFFTNASTETRASSVSMALAADSTQNIGQVISGKLYMYNGTNQTWDEVASTDFHEIVSADLGVFVTLPFLNDYFLQPNSAYRVMAKAEAFASNIDFLGAQYVAAGAAIKISDGITPEMYAYDRAPLVRLNVADLASYVEENEGDISLGQNFPNPFKGNTTINYSLVNADEVMVEITDVTGKVVKVINEGTRAAGTHSIVVNSNDLPAGLYHYSIVTSNGKVTKAMTVAK